MPDRDVRLKKMPSPETVRAADVDTRVRLSHWGDVSRRLCLGWCKVILTLELQLDPVCFEIAHA